MTSFISKIPDEQVAILSTRYEQSLFSDIIPWWIENSIDYDHGGYYSCLERDGVPYADDKYIWMVSRQIWMFSHLYNNHAGNDKWLQLAQHGEKFLTGYAFAENGKMHFRVDKKGRPLAQCLSIYTECFAAIALAELSKACDDPQMWNKSVSMYNSLMARLEKPTDTAMLGYPLNVEFHLHSHDMMRITLAWVFNEVSPGNQWINDIEISVDSILKKHWKPELGVLLENVSRDGTPMLDIPEGRMVHPGHAIETAWMLMEFASLKQDDELMNTAVTIALSSLDIGWDNEYGGIRYLRNLDASPMHPLEADLKLWWPHTEALYALLLAWSYTGQESIKNWYERVQDYSFDSFPDKEYGEWFGYLNRDGSTVFTAKATGWKGFFHLPRILFRAYRLLNSSKINF